MVGDWNGSGSSKVGVFDKGGWKLDLNGDGAWELRTDLSLRFGTRFDTPVVGDWNGSATTKIGVFNKGDWQLDINGNGVWDGAPTDRVLKLGGPDDRPVPAQW